MRKLDRLAVNDSEVLRALVLRAPYQTLAGVTDAILDRYAEFERADLGRAFPATPPALQPHDDIMSRLYESGSNCIVTLKRAIRELGVPCCPYCGGMSTVFEIDHFLPRSDFPELAICSANLVPCCGECNSAKHDHLPWIAPTVVNPYRAEILDQQLLELEYGRQVFTLKARSTLSEEANIAVTGHIDRFRIEENFNSFAQQELLAIRSSYRNLILTNTEIAVFLRGMGRGLADVYGVNHWRVLLYDFVADNPDLLNDFAARI